MSGCGRQPARMLAAGIHPLGWLATSVTLGLGAAQGMKDEVPPWAVALCVFAATAAGVAGRQARKVGGAMATLGAGSVVAVALNGIAGSPWSVTLLVIGLACGVPWLGGRYLHQQDELAGEATQRARLQERNRIAQDMHDSIGHELNLLALRAGAIEMNPALTAAHRSAASELRAGASTAITQLAAVIGMLRGDGPVAWEATRPDVEKLVRRAADAGMKVTLERSGPDDAPLSSARCVHHVIQEGITNAARHAPGSAVTVSIDGSATGTAVVVVNTPPNASLRRNPGSRTGFATLHERLRSCGGTMSAEPHHGGFRLSVHVPHGAAW